MFKAAIGHSIDVDSIDAITEVLNQCRKGLGSNIPKAGFLFSAIDHDHEKMLKFLLKRYPDLQLIGCTTDGELSSKLGFQDDSVTLILFTSDSIEFGAGLGEGLSSNITKACSTAVKLAGKHLNNKGIKLAITTPDSLTVSGVKILNGLSRELGRDFPIFGGTAGDQYRMKKTFQFFGDKVYTDSVPVMLISGAISYSHGIYSGWTPVGKKLKVTKVKGNIIFEVEKRPALDLYLHYFGKGSTIFGEYPIAVFNKKSDKFYYIRSPIKFNEKDRSITYSGEVPLNAYIQFAEGTRTEIINAAKDSVQEALKRFSGSSPEAALVFSCSARKSLLGTRTRDEFNLIKDVIKKDIKICGFYTYGEIGACTPCSNSSFHNSTFITLLLGEEVRKR
ncbi:MAG: FIST N-terminal domain-containing protein [bacterium]|nr:FIST N-terminal domain-containing protein [bacterium]